jgi:hypothetical protein
VLDSELERLCHVVGVNVMHELGAQPWNCDLLTCGKGVPDARIEISQRSDRHPTRTAYVTGLEHGRGEAAGCGLGSQQLGDGSLLRTVFVERRRGVVLPHRLLDARPVPPDGPAVDQVPAMSAQFLHERSR